MTKFIVVRFGRKMYVASYAAGSDDTVDIIAHTGGSEHGARMIRDKLNEKGEFDGRKDS